MIFTIGTVYFDYITRRPIIFVMPITRADHRIDQFKVFYSVFHTTRKIKSVIVDSPVFVDHVYTVVEFYDDKISENKTATVISTKKYTKIRKYIILCNNETYTFTYFSCLCGYILKTFFLFILS